MLTTETIEKLENSPISSFGDLNEICIQFMKNLGVSENTGFFDVHKYGGWLPTSNGGGALYPLGQIMNNLEKGWGLEGLEDFALEQDLITKFIRMDSIEGEFSYYYEVDSDCVHVCHWGGEEEMISHRKSAKFKTSYDFFNWFYRSE